jgi:hypothetical protein
MISPIISNLKLSLKFRAESCKIYFIFSSLIRFPQQIKLIDQQKMIVKEAIFT